MEKLSVKEIINAVSGELILCDKNIDNICINSVCIDSNEVKNTKDKNILFIPLIGNRVDAHKFIESAFKSGAKLCLSSKSLNELEIDKSKKYNIIKTLSTLEALQNIAKYYRSKFNIPIIGVTGSSGKTSTKDMISSALSQSLNILKTHGNQNNTIGLPLNILNLERNYDVAIIEMGIGEVGEMTKLAEVAQNNLAVVTNIGFSHIANFGSKDNILKEKLHITDYMPSGSTLFVNGDDPLLANLHNYKNFNIISFGTNTNCTYRAENIHITTENSSFDLRFNNKIQKITLHVPGKHNIFNALAAIAVGINLKLDIEKLITGISNYKNPSMRQNIYNINGAKIIDDSYNANPDSMKNAIDVLNILGKDKNKILLCADMLELGDFAEQAHFDVGKYAAQNGVSRIISLGELSKNIISGAKSINSQIKAEAVISTEEAYYQLKNSLKPDDVVLIKGSRGMQLDKVVKKLVGS